MEEEKLQTGRRGAATMMMPEALAATSVFAMRIVTTTEQEKPQTDRTSPLRG